jgi:toxin ParE1/3/4
LTTYILTLRSQKEIDDIADYTLANWGEAQADRYIAALYDRFAWLAGQPLLGKKRDDLSPDVRSFRQGSHVVFYRSIKGGIEIVGIVHASADFEAYFDSN